MMLIPDALGFGLAGLQLALWRYRVPEQDHDAACRDCAEGATVRYGASIQTYQGTYWVGAAHSDS